MKEFEKREKVSVAQGLEESVLSTTISSACDIQDCLSKFFDENGAIEEGGGYIRLGRLGKKDRSPVIRDNLFCDESGEHTGS